ncbi:hypothetical protein FA95DRAFT_1560696 [Auriscalpium vulgare]|uniref:Uncharacterized protein n=1 Tax=Auriscalpium vulgare TaxID=40419 RepID=A0ACB8RPQ7_9AGAM|nr:hypothetical protein FA95DRAFT_1560696 [Auriscalpium vulgare]
MPPRDQSEGPDIPPIQSTRALAQESTRPTTPVVPAKKPARRKGALEFSSPSQPPPKGSRDDLGDETAKTRAQSSPPHVTKNSAHAIPTTPSNWETSPARSADSRSSFSSPIPPLHLPGKWDDTRQSSGSKLPASPRIPSSYQGPPPAQRPRPRTPPSSQPPAPTPPHSRPRDTRKTASLPAFGAPRQIDRRVPVKVLRVEPPTGRVLVPNSDPSQSQSQSQSQGQKASSRLGRALAATRPEEVFGGGKAGAGSQQHESSSQQHDVSAVAVKGTQHRRAGSPGLSSPGYLPPSSPPYALRARGERSPSFVPGTPGNGESMELSPDEQRATSSPEGNSSAEKLRRDRAFVADAGDDYGNGEMMSSAAPVPQPKGKGKLGGFELDLDIQGWGEDEPPLLSWLDVRKIMARTEALRSSAL